jgi:hypothetical protein
METPAYVDHSLTANVENLVLLGAAVNLTGNGKYAGYHM